MYQYFSLSLRKKLMRVQQGPLSDPLFLTAMFEKQQKRLLEEKQAALPTKQHLHKFVN